ncbi:hypothetical protein KVR01_010859 [Diaporthe batatas]|uniref:uncharacterized protein n=1 Tax=Diaporthe batatas TaxID=748121 RepID=UPI001D03805C|nr:uncharacterized protein KVR01_010859 [Diaporthe batatas]KAG8159198.1 hypothetical protein KVR01_010859 [Diaporthe batatas]
MTGEEIEDTIAVAWPPKPQASEDETARTKATPTKIANSATPRPPRKTEQRSIRICGFCRPYLGPNGVCGHVKERNSSA